MRVYSGVEDCHAAAAPGIWNVVEPVNVVDTVGLVFDMHGMVISADCVILYIICKIMGKVYLSLVIVYDTINTSSVGKGVFMREVRTGEIYRHFKGNLYQIVAVARHSETNENYVVYLALYGDMQVWVRPYDMFVGEVDHEKYPQVKQKYRFELLNTLAGAGNGNTSNVVNINNGMGGGNVSPTINAGQSNNTDNVLGTDNAARTSSIDNNIGNSQIASSDSTAAQKNDDDEYAELKRQGVDVRLLEFLDAPTCQDKINYLNLIRGGIDDDLINNIAAAMDITVDDGPIDTRFFSLRSCLMTKAKYECSRR